MAINYDKNKERPVVDSVKTGEFLAALRKAAGYTQQEVADYLGITNKTVSKWESGAGLPEIGILPAVAEMYDVTVDELLAGVIDEFALRVGEVDVAAAGQFHGPADLLDAGEAHVHQQNAAVGAALPCELHIPAQGHHPPETVVRVGKEVLDVGGGKVEVFHLVQRLPLLLQSATPLEVSHRKCSPF